MVSYRSLRRPERLWTNSPAALNEVRYPPLESPLPSRSATLSSTHTHHNKSIKHNSYITLPPPRICPFEDPLSRRGV
ncbi:hypothetical protein RRG08_025019 [Elysia crispata]|uniref:Uncharacterized protein n=1 Tax=Elysia crispata TaxID=231223 RepID=A0AAE1ANU1_9GAST|nr:hypothetical protein RRG08_025019 [Elysia crispata]